MMRVGSDESGCLHCGAHVTDRFAAVFGDEDGDVHRCPGCDSIPRISRGSAAGKTVETHVDPDGDELQVKVEPRSDISVGESVTLGFDPDRFHLFDRSSGAAVYHSTTRDDEGRPPTDAASPVESDADASTYSDGDSGATVNAPSEQR